MKSKLQIIVGSPVDYNDLVAYIQIDAIVDMEEGKENMKVEFYAEGLNQKKFDCNVLIEALQKAKQRLLI